MTDLPTAFTWEAPANRDGFDLIEVRGLEIPGGACEAIRPAPVNQRHYRPFDEETGLFLTLADTPADAEEILRFANTYGRLGVGAWLPGEAGEGGVVSLGDYGLKEGDRTLRFADVQLETISAWQWYIRWMNGLTGLWHMARLGDTGVMSRFFIWDSAGVSFFKLPALSQFSPREGRGRLLTTAQLRAAGVERGDLVGAAYVVLGEALSGQLTQAPTGLGWDPEKRQPFLSPQVRDLWSAICLQFAAAVAGDKSFEQCRSCGKWFELAPGVNRAGRLTCSATCRQRVYRGRMERARELHAEGRTVKEIAREVGSSVAAVRRWVAGRKED
jgi:hypothetical protein